MPAPRAHRWKDERESSSRGKREQGTKAVAVKFQSKKVDWRLSKRKIFYVSYMYIEASINECEKSSYREHYWVKLRITVDPVIILISTLIVQN